MFATYTLWAPGNMAVGLQNKFLSGSKKKRVVYGNHVIYILLHNHLNPFRIQFDPFL